MGKNVSDHHFLKHLAMSWKCLTAFVLAVFLVGVSLPAEVLAENTTVPFFTIGGVEVSDALAEKYGFSMERTENGIILKVTNQSRIEGPLKVNGELTIEGSGSLTVNAGDSNDYAIFAADGITIMGADVTASSGRRAAIYSPGIIQIENSIVKADAPSGSKGILSGIHVWVFDSWLESTGNNYELYYAESSVVFQEENGIMVGMITEGSEQSEGVILPGNVSLPGSLEIPEGINLVIPSGKTLTIPEGFDLTVTGAVENHGIIDVKGGLEDPGEQIDNHEGEGSVRGVKVRELLLELEDEIMNVGESRQCSVRIVPYYAENPQIVWNSSDSSVISVENGILHALRVGTAVITVRAGDGSTAEAECGISVNETAVTGVSLNQTSAVMHVNQTLQLTETITPETAVNKKVMWSSADEGIAAVDGNGLVTARNVGVTTITVTTEDGNKSAACDITVEAVPVQGITLNSTVENLPVGKSLQLSAVITPEDATDQSVRWSSSDEKVASVDQNGNVEAKAEGTVQITAAAQEGDFTAVCEITVYAIPVGEITLTPSSTTLAIGKTLTLTPKILPADATDQKITWTSSDKEIAAVNDQGLVKALKTGTVMITAAAADGSGIVGTSQITVITIPVTGVKLDRTSASIPDDGAITLKAEVLPADATNNKVVWKTSNPQSAVVDASGKVTAVKAGTAQIIVTTVDGKKEAVCTITVTSPDKPANAAALNKKIKISWDAKKKGLILTWGKAPDADGYEIYTAKCGTDLKFAKTINGTDVNSITLKKINGKTLKDQSSYRACVKAYRIFNGKKQYLARSFSVHTVKSINKKYTNVKKLTVSDRDITLKYGDSKRLKVQMVSQNSKKKLLGHTEKIRYFSSDGKVATVTTSGTVKAVGKGKCTIYALAVNGVKTPVRVTVK